MEDFGTGERERLLQRFGKRLTAGQVIYREGELGSEAFLLQEGRVRLIKRVRTAERSLMVLRPGDLFGESAFIAGAPRSSTAIALSDGTALAFDNATFQNLLENNRPVASRVGRLGAGVGYLRSSVSRKRATREASAIRFSRRESECPSSPATMYSTGTSRSRRAFTMRSDSDLGTRGSLAPA